MHAAGDELREYTGMIWECRIMPSLLSLETFKSTVNSNVNINQKFQHN